MYTNLFVLGPIPFIAQGLETYGKLKKGIFLSNYSANLNEIGHQKILDTSYIKHPSVEGLLELPGRDGRVPGR